MLKNRNYSLSLSLSSAKAEESFEILNISVRFENFCQRFFWEIIFIFVFNFSYCKKKILKRKENFYFFCYNKKIPTYPSLILNKLHLHSAYFINYYNADLFQNTNLLKFYQLLEKLEVDQYIQFTHFSSIQ